MHFEDAYHKIPVSFTLVGDHVLMTVSSWTRTRQEGTFAILRLVTIPKEYRPKEPSNHGIHVFSGSELLQHGTVEVNNSLISIGVNYQNEHVGSTFMDSGKVGFPQFTVMYYLK